MRLTVRVGVKIKYDTGGIELVSVDKNACDIFAAVYFWANPPDIRKSQTQNDSDS